MPKRKSEDRIEYYTRKIKDNQRKYQRIIYSSSEDSDEDNELLHDHEPSDTCNADQSGRNGTLNIEDSGKRDDDQEPVPELDPDILTALGETTEETPRFGPKIHESLARLWLPILRRGMKNDVKETLLKEYLIPENCPLLQAPKLNPEILAAVADGTRTRDKRVETVQQQLGVGIAALNKGLILLLDNDRDRLQAVKHLSDSCRILCDLHFVESEARKKFVTPGLDKSFLNIMQDIDRDETLFGSKLTEKIKATKAIEKHGLQIKKPAPNHKASFYQPSTSRARPQGNWGGPPRTSFNRGGRGGQKKMSAGRKGASAGGTAQQKQSAPAKPRATSQQ